jgi:hypothetical protein
MTLKKGKSKKTMADNYNKEIASGKKPAQAKAIMLSEASGKPKKKKNKKK